jgi:hypothetical protein
MLLVSQDERDRLIGEFWGSVRARLIDHYHRSQSDADRGIGQYRHVIYHRGVGDLVYHQGVEKTAEVVDTIITHGLPESP